MASPTPAATMVRLFDLIDAIGQGDSESVGRRAAELIERGEIRELIGGLTGMINVLGGLTVARVAAGLVERDDVAGAIGCLAGALRELAGLAARGTGLTDASCVRALCSESIDIVIDNALKESGLNLRTLQLSSPAVSTCS